MTSNAIPMLSYEDCDAAAAWLVRAFGFRELDQQFTDDEGRVTHVELETGGGLVMLGWPGADYQGPRKHAEGCEDAARWLDTPYVVDGVFVSVGDVDAHLEVALASGAEVPLRGPEEQPLRSPVHGGRSGRSPLDVHAGDGVTDAVGHVSW